MMHAYVVPEDRKGAHRQAISVAAVRARRSTHVAGVNSTDGHGGERGSGGSSGSGSNWAMAGQESGAAVGVASQTSSVGRGIRAHCNYPGVGAPAQDQHNDS